MSRTSPAPVTSIKDDNVVAAELAEVAADDALVAAEVAEFAALVALVDAAEA